VGALLAMGSGLSMSLYYIAVNHPWVQMRLQLHSVDTVWWGMDPVCAGVFAVPTGLLLGFLGSKLTSFKN
jgi:cation/acetate symporter